MSAEIIKLKLPERRFRPNSEWAFKAIDTIEPDENGERDAGLLFRLAELGMGLAKKEQSKDNPTPEAMQRAIDCIALAWFSLAEILGVPRGDTLPPAG